MNYDMPDLKQKLQSFRTLPAEDILELATNVSIMTIVFLKNISAASIIRIELFASEPVLSAGVSLAIKFLERCSSGLF
jgi:hypothetical protein